MSGGVQLLVVDSSVAYKWFDDEGETHVPQARELVSRHMTGEVVIAAPAHMPAEVINGLRYSRLDPAALSLAVEGLAESEIVLFPPDAELLGKAVDLALAYELTVYDALFPALAVILECDLVTADRAQARVRECPIRLLQ